MTSGPSGDQVQAYLDSPDFDPIRFMASLVPDPNPSADVQLPPRLRDDEVVLVRRIFKLPAEIDAGLRAAAAAEHLSVEELLSRWTREHNAA